MRRAGLSISWWKALAAPVRKWNATLLFLQTAVVLHAIPLVSATIDPAERQALVDLYLATNGTAWTNHDGFNAYADASNDPCTRGWIGMTCVSGEIM